MEIGERIYYQKGDSLMIHSTTYLGETSRSWLTGVKWRPTKLPKKTTTFKTEADYRLQMWADKHSYHIANKVRYASAGQLKQIADFIGYTDESL